MNYRIVFSQVGRSGTPQPLEIIRDSNEPLPVDVLEQLVVDHVRGYLVSREVSATLDLGTSEGSIFAGIRRVGSFTITVLRGVANA